MDFSLPNVVTINIGLQIVLIPTKYKIISLLLYKCNFALIVNKYLVFRTSYANPRRVVTQRLRNTASEVYQCSKYQWLGENTGLEQETMTLFRKISLHISD